MSQPLQLDVAGAALAGVDTLAAELWAPTVAGPLDAYIFCCVAGGKMSRRYWDLRPPNGDGSYSMARYLSGQGGWVLLIDLPGVGDSPAPEDPWVLTPSVLADVVAAALEDALRGLGPLRALGVGHSMGALLMVHAQARHRPFRALALLGFADRGLPDALGPQELAYRPHEDPAGDELVRLARARFDAPLRSGRRSVSTESLLVGVTDAAARAALSDARSPLLGVAGLASIIPRASVPQLEAVRVPVFLGVGQHDITGPSHRIPGDFPNSNDITLFVVQETGHNHNAAEQRFVLWARLAAWAGNLR